MRLLIGGGTLAFGAFALLTTCECRGQIGAGRRDLARINGIWGHPFIDLTRYIDTSQLSEIDEEICYALTQVATEYTGGSHRTLGIVPPSSPMRATPTTAKGSVALAELSLPALSRCRKIRENLT
jgi:hypothetical protein